MSAIMSMIGGLPGLLSLGGGVMDQINADKARAQTEKQWQQANRLNTGFANQMLGQGWKMGDYSGGAYGDYAGQLSKLSSQMTPAMLGMLGGQYNQLMDAYGNAQGQMGAGTNQAIQQFNRTNQPMDRGYRSAIGGLESGYNTLGQGYGGLGSQLGGQYGTLTDAYGGRTERGMGMLEGMGQQAAADIRDDYRRSGAATQADLARRGLGGSSVSAGATSANQREQQNSLNRLNETLRQQQFNAYAGLSGEQLGAQERGYGNVANIGLAGLGAQQSGIESANAARMGRLGAQERANMARLDARLGSQSAQNALAAQQLGAQQQQGNLISNTYGNLLGNNLGLQQQLGAGRLNLLSGINETQRQNLLGPQYTYAPTGGMNAFWQMAAARQMPQPETNDWAGIMGGTGSILSGVNSFF